MKKTICPKCKITLDSTAKYCPMCGSPVSCVCSDCGAELPEAANFCLECGAPMTLQATEEVGEQENKLQKEAVTKEEQFQEIPQTAKASIPDKKRNPKGKGFVRELMKRCVLLVISILMLLLVFFPTYVYKVESDDFGDVKIKLNAIDGIVFGIDTLMSVPQEEMEESELYDSLTEYGEQLDALYGSDGIEREDRKEAADITAKILKLSTRMRLRLESVPFRSLDALVMLICVLYLLAAVAFFVISLVDFILFLCKKNNRKLRSASFRLLTLFPVFPVLTYAAIYFSSYFNRFAVNGGARTHTMGAAAILAIIFSTAGVIYFIVDRILFEKAVLKAGYIVRRSFSIAVCLLVLISLFLPALSFNLKGSFDSSVNSKKESASIGYDSSFLSILPTDEESLESLEDMRESECTDRIKEQLSVILEETKRAFKQGATGYHNFGVISLSLGGYGAPILLILLSQIPTLLLLAGLLAYVLLWQNLVAMITGQSPKGYVSIPAKIFTVTLIVCALALLITMMVVCNTNLGNSAIKKVATCSIGIGVGMITAVGASIAVACIPMKESVRVKETREDEAAPEDFATF